MYLGIKTKPEDISRREPPQGIEDRIQFYGIIKSTALKNFEVTITNYLAKITDCYGIYNGNREELIIGLRGELIPVYSAIFEIPKVITKLIESNFDAENCNQDYLANVLARDFIMTTGFNDELKRFLLSENTLEYSSLKKFLMQRIANNLDQLLMGDLSSL